MSAPSLRSQINQPEAASAPTAVLDDARPATKSRPINCFTHPQLLAPQGGADPNFAYSPFPTVWPNGNVFYRFDPAQVANNTITAVKMQGFRDAMGDWAAFANLRFIETSNPPAHVITVKFDPDAVGGYFVKGSGTGEQFIGLGPTDWTRHIMCHEMGHGLGLDHEQQRPDRDTYVVVLWNNIPADKQANYGRVDNDVPHGPYDFYSVMHYSRKFFTINPSQDSLVPQPAYSQFLDIMGKVDDRPLSKLDRAGMAEIFGAPSPLPSAVVTNTKDGGPGSLRAALYYAFDRSTDVPPVPTTISFRIPTSDPGFDGKVFTIKPTHVLVAPGAGTTIDGSSQTAFTGETNPNGPEVVINGSLIAPQGLSAPGLILREANCTIKNLIINGFNQQGIAIFGSSAFGNVVTGCYIGTDLNGAAGVANALSGIEISGGAQNNLIGGSAAAARNIIAGNLQHGVAIRDAGSNGNVVLGNYIGLNAAGTGTVSNTLSGIKIFGGAQDNIIGGALSGARNVISGNKAQGILISDSGTADNAVFGNLIGLNAAGTTALGNGFADIPNHVFYPGIEITNGAQANVIGDAGSGSANVISGNARGGISINGSGTNNNWLKGNFIGLNLAGTTAPGNGFADVANNYRYAGLTIAAGAQGNIVGGTSTGQANIISGNAAQGVLLTDTGSSSNLVQGNIIGLNPAQTAAMPNTFAGVGLAGGASANRIGGPESGARNVISGNGAEGISIAGVGTNQNLVQGNHIGLNDGGTAAIPNSGSGVGILSGAQANILGGLGPMDHNVISGNGDRGVHIRGSGTNLNLVQGNFIGINASGINKIANVSSGVEISDGAQSNAIGGTAAGAGNFISGNNNRGVSINGLGTNGNMLQGNTIGLNIVGGALGNAGQGVAVLGGARLNTIGGGTPGAGNVISSNQQEGVALFDVMTFNNSVSQNSIFNNVARGIDIFANANNQQSFPSLASVVLSTPTNPAGTDVTGSLTSAPSKTFRIEFFANAVPHSSGFGEGRVFIGSTNVTTNSSGSVNFIASLNTVLPNGYFIAATATDPSGNTSEFSATVAVATSDSDGDGMPNNYEDAVGLNRNRATDANLDSDGDGMTNLQEFKAGTDPKSAASRLQVVAVDKSAGLPRVTFQAVPGKTYRLEFRDNLITGNWSALIYGIFANATSIQISDYAATGLDQRYYRVTLEP